MMEWLPPIALREPWWLLLAPLSGMLWLWWRRTGRSPAALRGYAEPHLLKWLVIAPGREGPPLLTLLGWALIAVAISGPVLIDRDRPQSRYGLDIAIVIDISPSMRVGDVAPDRLRRARLELEDLLHRLDGADRVTLIAFSAHAYPLMPLTTDTALVSWFLDALDPALTRRHGSDVIPALEQAARRLGGDREADNRAVVLISDGEFRDPAALPAVTGRLAELRIPVFVLGIGTPTGGPIPIGPPNRQGWLRDARDETVISRLDRPRLQRIATDTGGRYTDVHADDRDRDHLLAGLEQLARERRPVAPAEAGTPLHSWPLAFGLALLLATRIRRLPAAIPTSIPVIACLLLTPLDGQAAPWSEHRAYEALEAGRHAEAAQLYREVDGYRGRLGQGAALYRMGRWSEALTAFSAATRDAGNEAERARASYNRANALARLGRLDEALAAYDRTLALQPDHRRAALNRDLVRRAMEASSASAEPSGAMREHDRARAIRPGMEQDPQAAGESPETTATPPRPGTEGSGPQRRVIARPRPGDGAPPTPSRLDVVTDHSREMLQHRFRLMDAAQPRTDEGQPW